MFKDRLREALDYRGLKAIELSERTGMSRGNISKYLSGHMEPKPAALHKIALALNVNDTWLMGYDVQMERTAVSSDQADEIIKRIRALPPDKQQLALSLLQTLIDSDTSKRQ